MNPAPQAANSRQARTATRDPRLREAADALAANRLAEAEQRLRAHLHAAPADVNAMRMLAEVAARLGRLDVAEDLLARALELAPGFRAARQNRAVVLHRNNKPAQALAELERLLADDPHNAGLRNLKAIVCSQLGEYDTAIAVYAGLLDEYPERAMLWLSYGHTLRIAGRSDESIAAYRRCIALERGFGEAWWSLANLKTLRFDATDIEAMRAELARGDLDEEHRLHFEFALGKALEDRADYAGSFRHYAAGNRLRRRAVPYDATAATGRTRRAIATFTREFFAARAGWGCPAADPIFVVGLPRSGSTLVEQILSSHSAVEGTMELHEVIAMARSLRREAAAGGADTDYHAHLATRDAAALRALGEQYLARTRVQRKTAAPFFVDKMPSNFEHVGLIHLMLPNARIVDVRRHPLACGFSVFKQHFARGQHFSYDLADIGHHYRDYVRLMAHFDAVLPGRVHRVIYERMVEDTEAEVRRLLAYCGLPFEAGCLRFFDSNRPVHTASSEQVRRPINRDGIDHWRHYDAWLAPMREALDEVLETWQTGAPAATA